MLKLLWSLYHYSTVFVIGWIFVLIQYNILCNTWFVLCFLCNMNRNCTFSKTCTCLHRFKIIFHSNIVHINWLMLLWKSWKNIMWVGIGFMEVCTYCQYWSSWFHFFPSALGRVCQHYLHLKKMKFSKLWDSFANSLIDSSVSRYELIYRFFGSVMYSLEFMPKPVSSRKMAKSNMSYLHVFKINVILISSITSCISTIVSL